MNFIRKLYKEVVDLSENAKRFFVITGGPGSGKSTLLEALCNAGYGRFTEAGRSIIQNQVVIGGQALPWLDPALFAELMLSWDMRSHHLAEQSTGLVFFDRGVVDVVGYLRLMDIPIPKHMQNAVEIFRYNPQVFVAPPWEAMYAQDRERKQDFTEAVRTYEAIIATYRENRYQLVELPLVSVEKRMRFVVESLGIK